jgi:hypothetical protein
MTADRPFFCAWLPWLGKYNSVAPHLIASRTVIIATQLLWQLCRPLEETTLPTVRNIATLAADCWGHNLCLSRPWFTSAPAYRSPGKLDFDFDNPGWPTRWPYW